MQNIIETKQKRNFSCPVNLSIRILAKVASAFGVVCFDVVSAARKQIIYLLKSG